MDRRTFLLSSTAATFGFTAACSRSPKQSAPFELDEISLRDLASGLKSGKHTARSLAEKYLARIEEIDRKGPALRSVIEANPDALSIADALDKERKEKGPRGPLHGVPILLKDNIDTGDKMLTTAGSLALAGAPARRDAFVAERLRAAGALILGKTNLSEWANIRSSRSTSGWSGRGGQTLCPYGLNRNPSGSSSGSGVAVAANLCAAAIGTETDGSIVSPASINGIVGVKPTVGLVSRAGIIPIAHSQDTAGPMTRTVADAALVLSALTGVDPRDTATTASRGKAEADYGAFLKEDGLKGARIGVARQLFGFNEHVEKVMDAALDVLKRSGAELIDAVKFPSFGQMGDAELEVLLYELKADLNAYLGAREGAIAVHSLKEVIGFNEKNREREMPYFGQDLFVKAEAKGPLTERAYLDALEKCRKAGRTSGIDAAMDQHRLDAIVAPTEGAARIIDYVNGECFSGGSSTYPAVAGYPHITVPAGFASGLPIGISFFGRPWSEGRLFQYAFAFEQISKARRPPRLV